MNRLTASLLFLLVLLSFAGCAVQGIPFERVTPPRGHAVIYVYRPYNYAASLLHPPVTCGDDSSQIGPGAYHAFVVAPGPVVCRVEGETTDEVKIDAEPRAYYIKEEFGWGLWSGHPHLNPIDSDTGNAEIESCCVQQP